MSKATVTENGGRAMDGSDDSASSDDDDKTEADSADALVADGESKGRRGFASMDRARVRAIGRMGGIAAHVAGTAHEFSVEEARAAGRKGAQARAAGRRRASVKAPIPGPPDGS